MQDNGVNRVFFQNEGCIFNADKHWPDGPALTMACLWWGGGAPGKLGLHSFNGSYWPSYILTITATEGIIKRPERPYMGTLCSPMTQTTAV